MSGTIQLGDGKGTGSKNELGGIADAAKVVLVDPTTGLPYVASGGGGGGGGAVTIADGANVTQGAKADTRATWYDQAASLIAHLKLLIAATVDAGSHVYGYTGGQLTSDAWTLFGTTRTKTYTYVAGVLTAESDWA